MSVTEALHDTSALAQPLQRSTEETLAGTGVTRAAGDTATRATLKFVDDAEDAPVVHIESEGGPTRYSGQFAMETVPIRDGRASDRDFRLERNGFELVSHRSSVADFEDEDAVENIFYPEVEALVKRATGASRVLIFDHTIRKDGNQQGRTPARHVHVDYTEKSGPDRVRDFLGAEDAEQLLSGRYQQVNVWRSIRGDIQRTPLAFLDAATLDSRDLVRTELRNQGRTGEIYSLRHDADQVWYSFPRMTENEAVLIKGFDSDRQAAARFTPHTAFDDPATSDDAPPRESIEVRTFAFFES